ncbi:MAG: hypothetical protein HGB21_14565 [Nitrospirae bacterium]|nr:hypothetical protein [Nitrospirota bacterium]
MKKECEHTRSLLPRYLKGHLFLPQQKRVERHLAACEVCRSKLDSLRQIDETQQILTHLSPPEGMAGRLKQRVSRLSGITRIFFRPLWLLAVAAISVAVYLYVITPLIHDPDLEKLDAGLLPPPAAKLETAPLSVPTSPPAAPAAPEPKRQSPPVATAPKADPLLVTITVEKESEKASIRRINEAMKEHPLLASLRFSDTVHEVSGRLTPDELYTFFNRIQDAGKISYKRSRLASAAKDEQLPFVLKLTSVSASPRLPVEQPAALPVDKPMEKAAESTASELPVTKPEDKPAPPSPQAPQ